MKNDFQNIENLNKLSNAHNHMQNGCYISHIIKSKELGLEYIISENIPDISWNYLICNEITKESLEWAKKTSHKFKKQTAVFSWSANAEFYKENNIDYNQELETWMLLNIDSLIEIRKPSIISQFKFIYNEKPGNDFEQVFASLFEDNNSNKHFINYYIPALKNFEFSSDIQVVHMIGYIQNQPVTCATAYMNKNKICGLYNVGTVFEYQKLGIGKWISFLILNEIKKIGAEQVFLQCEYDGYVESMYSKLGFTRLATPSLIVLK